MIKHLQNNFTTVEQSKRLLELGVPADSADCIIQDYSTADEKSFETYRLYIIANGESYNFGKEITSLLPCWSVGRLREIFCICSSVNGTREYPFCNDQVAWWITEFEFKKEFIDFSKLEED